MAHSRKPSPKPEGALPPRAPPVYAVVMSRKPDRGDEAFTHNQPDRDPLGAIYSDFVTPDIEEMTEHADSVADAKKAESDQM